MRLSAPLGRIAEARECTHPTGAFQSPQRPSGEECGFDRLDAQSAQQTLCVSPDSTRSNIIINTAAWVRQELDHRLLGAAAPAACAGAELFDEPLKCSLPIANSVDPADPQRVSTAQFFMLGCRAMACGAAKSAENSMSKLLRVGMFVTGLLAASVTVTACGGGLETAEATEVCDETLAREMACAGGDEERNQCIRCHEECGFDCMRLETCPLTFACPD